MAEGSANPGREGAVQGSLILWWAFSVSPVSRWTQRCLVVCHQSLGEAGVIQSSRCLGPLQVEPGWFLASFFCLPTPLHYNSRSVMSDSAAPWTVAHQAPLSMEFSRKEYWSGLPFPSPPPHQWSESCSAVSYSLRPHGLYSSPWNSPGQNTGVGSLPFSRGPSRPSDRTQVSHIAGGFFTS